MREKFGFLCYIWHLMYNMLKKIGKIVLLVLIFVGGFAVGLGTKFYIDEWRAARNVALWMKSFEAPYKNDRFGGKTPEETFDMYLAALKKGDLELASRYFWVDKQKGELEDLKEMKDRGELQVYIDELVSVKKENWKKIVEDNKMIVEYSGYRKQPRAEEVVNEKFEIVKEKLSVGSFKDIATFKNLNNIWKIYSL